MALAAAHPGALVRAARAGASALQRASSRAPPASSPPRLRGASRASVPCPRVAVTSPASTSADEEPFGAPSHGSGAGVPDLASLTDPAELDLLVNLLPPKVRGTLSEHPRKLSLLEVVLDLGRRPIARFADGDEFLSEDVLDYADIERALENVGEIGGDNRAGINRTLHRISVSRNRAGGVVGLTCRVGRAISGGADLVRDLIDAGASVLLLGRPGVGKTTAIREISRHLSETALRRVVVVDTSNEIGGDGDVPHPGIGLARRMQVPAPDEQHHVLIEAVQNHTPEVVIVDEIGTELEAAAARTISQRGVQMIATAHGHTLENVLKNPSLCDLVGGVVSVTLGDDEARRRRVQKSVLEREGPPTFGVAVEMRAIGHWRVHLDVGVAVDTLLAGYEPHVEIREIDPETNRVVARPHLGDGFAGFGNPAGFGDAYDAILGGWGETGFAGTWNPPSAAGRVLPPRAEASSSSGLAAREVAEAAAKKRGESLAETGEADGAPDGSGEQPFALFRVYPYELDCDMLESVIESLGLSEEVALTSVLEEASAVLAVKSRVKGATWLRHAARARGMPIYALKAEGMPQVTRAMRAMLGLTDGLGGDGRGGGSEPASAMATATAAAAAAAAAGGRGVDDAGAGGGGGSNARGGERRPFAVSPPDVPRDASPAEESDALEEVRMAVEQLVIPHQEPVELLPRDARVLAMQAALIAEEYRLEFEETGEGASRRIKILHTYASEGGEGR